MTKREVPGEFECMVLRAVLDLKENAYSISIREWLSERFPNRSFATGAIYTTLDRMEEKGYLDSSWGDSTPQRGGKRKRLYKVNGLGEAALRAGFEYRGQLAGILSAIFESR